ncbi:endonuclease/exonuclease/phosphatase (EEP) superfamily protein YafD [Palleronia aestuarii]|uniref:Endonuclease/exonuclease/phosphatase (EEP) superfamily protein YafD n=1 Tax=Palleronia aestuarii TaxID=568105 RepID=A0A2W7NP06_9RHOB|nr:endonuclease/exonuclease/phosphatase family protein [Palleronia aestuarii]PZX18334.1 endonuclease/exonuclease/phosphatase (EEP) superfamily protein YafD [Palleronia aestuarii]
MLATAYDVIVYLLTAAVAVVSILPFIRSYRWWVRACDFPRVQILVAAIAVLVAAWFLPTPWRWVAMVILLLCIGYQSFRILPFTRLYPSEMKIVPRSEEGSQVTIVSSNVEMTNDRHGDVVRLIEDEDPDVLFLMETDEHWQKAVESSLSRYETVLQEIRDNYYGMIFATRLKVVRHDIVYLTPGDTPTLFAELETRAGQRFRLVGLHPRPPVPGENTADRDAEMIYAARFAAKTETPVIAMGDFNDAAWSHTSRHFKRVGGYLDPRVGRGMYASFDANSRLLRAPIDQFYATPKVAVAEFRRGPNIGSDHFPMMIRVDLDPERAKAANRHAKALPEATEEDVERIFAQYRERIGHDLLD